MFCQERKHRLLGLRLLGACTYINDYSTVRIRILLLEFSEGFQFLIYLFKRNRIIILRNIVLKVQRRDPHLKIKYLRSLSTLISVTASNQQGYQNLK